MINVLAFYPQPADTPSYYRGAVPLGYLHKVMPGMNLRTLYPGDADADHVATEMASADVFFCQRAMTQEHLSLVEAAKTMGVPIWLDYDDDILELPIWDVMYGDYQRWKMFAIQCITAADVITCSTEHIATKLRQFCKKVLVIPNAFDDIGPLLSRRSRHEKSDDLVTWRGSSSHAMDIAAHAKEFHQAMERHPETRFHSMGHFPHAWIDGLKNKWAHHGKNRFYTYLATLSGLKPRIHIVPLVEHSFNFAKSHCAWIEATYAGAAVLAPDWPEWQRPGIENYKAGEFGYKLRKLLSETPEETRARVELGWREITNKYSLTHTVMTRKAVLQNMLSEIHKAALDQERRLDVPNP